MSDEKPNNDDPLVAALRRNARKLNRRRWRWAFFGPGYHLFADALFWIDESPPWTWGGDSNFENALRLLWHYRTGLILGEVRPYGDL